MTGVVVEVLVLGEARRGGVSVDLVTGELKVEEGGGVCELGRDCCDRGFTGVGCPGEYPPGGRGPTGPPPTRPLLEAPSKGEGVLEVLVEPPYCPAIGVGDVDGVV